MSSFLQSIQKQLGKTTSEIPPPSLRELTVDQLSEPTVGWLPETDYALYPPQTTAVNLWPVKQPLQAAQPLLSVVTLGSLPGSDTDLLAPSEECLRFLPLTEPTQAEATSSCPRRGLRFPPLVEARQTEMPLPCNPPRLLG